MFEWSGFAERVADGQASPLDGARPGRAGRRLPARLDQDQALALIEVTQAVLAAVGAVQALGVEAFARREQESIVLFRADARARVGSACGVKDAHEVPAMLAPVFHLAPRTMANVLGETQLLVNALPRTFALVRAGRLEVSRARAVANEAVPVGPGLRRRYEAQLYGGDAAAGEPKRLAAVTGLSYGALRARATRAASGSTRTRRRTARPWGWVSGTCGSGPGPIRA